ncbi:hypothetical protein D3C84_1028960 [compost metagenome]
MHQRLKLEPKLVVLAVVFGHDDFDFETPFNTVDLVNGTAKHFIEVSEFSMWRC